MATNKRNIPMMVDPDFDNLVRQVQVMLRKKEGENYSFRKITKMLSKMLDGEKVSQMIIDIENKTMKIASYNFIEKKGNKKEKTKFLKMDER